MNVQLHRGGKVHAPNANGRKLPACATGRDQAGVLSANNERRYRWTQAAPNCTKCATT